jgi:hypothetical protein
MLVNDHCNAAVLTNDSNIAGDYLTGAVVRPAKNAE